jgi:hypothetical protein
LLARRGRRARLGFRCDLDFPRRAGPDFEVGWTLARVVLDGVVFGLVIGIHSVCFKQRPRREEKETLFGSESSLPKGQLVTTVCCADLGTMLSIGL